MPLTMLQIERWTRRVTEVRSANVKVTRMQKGRRKSKNPVVRSTTFTTHNDDGTLRRNPNKYVTWVEGLTRDARGKPRKLSNRSHVKVSCTCPYFVFYGCEVELHKRGAADIKFSNGKDPIIRNPKFRPWACVEQGTLITTKRGKIPIELVSVDDMILTREGYKRVLVHAQTGILKDGLLIKSESHYVRVTQEHLMIVLRRGKEVEMPANKIKLTDELILESGETTTVTSITPIICKKVYDMTIEDKHEYYANGILVHNCKHLIALFQEIQIRGY